ncbi:hypothetical protein SB49_12270 [Sediminicola sp. YIK13]|uniref:DUF4174 domain-containing protein n=1 Tax=Sediminicola sp. YIK13 TaxID=1453352 RepID=UPI00071EED98|nr:DUF4174 domain-containing protein [Sediminicola sp. YIK13]ALM08498.1 hypothetical protein SB49_12270 [Sediminicola sp. YIK13]
MNNEKLTQQSSKGIYLAIILFLHMVIGVNLLQAQEPSSFQWKNRLVLILVNDLSEEVYIKQLAELNAHKKGLEERKLIVYHIQPHRYTVGLAGQSWQHSKRLYKKYKKTKATFEIILVGLDGGNKLHRIKFLGCKELFNTIDAMPMRRLEKH